MSYVTLVKVDGETRRAFGPHNTPVEAVACGQILRLPSKEAGGEGGTWEVLPLRQPSFSDVHHDAATEYEGEVRSAG